MTNESQDKEQLKPPLPGDSVVHRFAFPSKLGKRTQSEVVLMTCVGSVIRIPISLLKEETAEQFLFEAKMPLDVARAFRSVYGELFSLTRSVQVQATRVKGGFSPTLPLPPPGED